MQTKIILLIDESTVISSKLISMLKNGGDNSGIFICEAGDKFSLEDMMMASKNAGSSSKQIVSNSKVKTIIMTDITNGWYKSFCEDMGVNYFLDKPSGFELVPKQMSNSMLN